MLMGQLLHRCATSTAAVRRGIQHTQESLSVPAGRHGINPKPVAKWKLRTSLHDLPTEPKDVGSAVLTVEEEPISSPSGGYRQSSHSRPFAVVPCAMFDSPPSETFLEETVESRLEVEVEVEVEIRRLDAA
jgi:hypothetical protein